MSSKAKSFPHLVGLHPGVVANNSRQPTSSGVSRAAAPSYAVSDADAVRFSLEINDFTAIDGRP